MLFILLWLLAPFITLALTSLWLGAVIGDLQLLAQILIASELLSLALGLIAYQLSQRLRLASIHLKIALTFALGLGITFLNILLVSIPMFISKQDTALLTILLVFAALVALGFGQLMARSITGGIKQLAYAAEKIAAGDLSTRAQVQSGDEVESLAASFNRMVEQLSEMQQREKEMQAARRTLVAAVSHDLRTPLTSLRAMIEAINDGVVNDEASIKRYMLLAQNEIQNLSRLVDDLFELTQMDVSGTPFVTEPGSLRDLISDTLESMQAQATAQGVELSGAVEPAIDPVPMNAFKIQRVLYNLLQNAIRHTPRGGSVRVTAVLLAAGANVRVQVADSGEGIAPSDLAHVFEPFYRGEKSRSRHPSAGSGVGAGLGLAIARGLVDAHGGTIGVESREGKGSQFYFTLPRG
ncbi:MAG: HAMP domain-containing protein [Chloroflexi bacterium]|nr:HAMP domain-containing protein [Chloroflexota bacterium]